MRILITLLTFVLFSLTLGAQESKLANNYYQNGEYEKAASLYKKLHKKQNNEYYFNRYVDCLIALEQFDETEKIIKQQLKKDKRSTSLYVTLGNLYEQQYEDEKAQKQYELAIERMPGDRYAITKLANAFVNLTKYDLAAQTYEKGSKILKDDEIFSYNLGDLYRRKGETTKMITNYLISLKANPNRLNSLQNLFQKYLPAEEDFDELQAQLYEYIQDDPDATQFTELLGWVFIQRKDYAGALRQAKALDRRLKENGSRIYKLAEVAANAKDYDTSIAAYEYITAEKGPNSSFYIEAKRKALSTQRKKITEGYDFTEENIRQLELQYNTFLDEFGRSKTTAPIIAELADLHAFYLNDLDKAIELLDQLIQYPAVNKHVQAKAKLSLADFYLMQGEIWEATLLYSQVDKAFAEDQLGHEARYRNAKLSYYAADFQWAQAQFDILKASTSKLISNDAIDLSVFILDNMGLDTSDQALQLYAESDLLIFQNRFDESFEKLDSITQMLPEHGLKDDVLFAKAGVFLKKRDYLQAADLYQQIVDNHAEEIRADNALFQLAEINELHLNDLEKAKSLYEKLFIDFSNSTFAVEARKRFRRLRGDDI